MNLDPIDPNNPHDRKLSLTYDLIASIRDEQRTFDMKQWLCTSPEFERTHLASCGTASCMAGHLEAIRPEIAMALVPLYMNSGFNISHGKLAAAIWKHETGEECLIDFMAYNYSVKRLGEQTREDAVLHILGVHPRWPQYTPTEPLDAYR